MIVLEDAIAFLQSIHARVLSGQVLIEDVLRQEDREAGDITVPGDEYTRHAYTGRKTHTVEVTWTDLPQAKAYSTARRRGNLILTGGA